MTHPEPPLSQLAQRLSADLALLELPARPWLKESAPDYDVIIVGAGLCGLTAAAALTLAGVTRILCLDKAPAGQEGPWITSARMDDLRTRKEAAGPALGIPSLTFRAWYEAQYGTSAYQAMARIPRALWMAYLTWYRTVLNLPVRNHAPVTRVEPGQQGWVEVDIATAQGKQQLRARRVVLATGIDGLGGPTLPPVARQIPARYIAHSADIIPPTQVAGKRVAVVGSGASAMDNAAFALENGAERVDIFYRRTTLPRIDKFTGIGHQGLTLGYVHLPDETKWQLMLAGEHAQIPPPRHSVQRVTKHANVAFHRASPLTSLREQDEAIALQTPHGQFHVDFIIFATGFRVDFQARPEFASFANTICQWRDRYHPAADQQHDGLASAPYLGKHFELLPKPGVDAEPATISTLYCFAFPAVLSHGKLTSGIPSIAEGAQRLTRGIVSSLLREDRAELLARFQAYDTPELLGDEWQETAPFSALPLAP
ncbi:NAD(P)-binding domain-containing protein [Symbiopectobacterium purcellii]|uniref:NAD(P)/FAD-dependent oxidoreductase n=1 Tax=Symbiopectobacterium purcellii TaxID=2871826 RepID=A0ABX9ARX6_9ENTR|nr:NAD(P)/FAD-dependent oxidoreductase [Symbiopectobacterium purcellii]QZN97526.1 NAD(P)/FAD-dependent oxidoreductase [Symbiopectobacterium purcellii]